MMEVDFSSRGGTVVFDDFHLDAALPISSQLDELKEDMLQVEFAQQRIIDVGWRPCFDVDGSFHVVLIKDMDWCSPLYAGSARTLEDLNAHVCAALAMI